MTGHDDELTIHDLDPHTAPLAKILASLPGLNVASAGHQFDDQGWAVFATPDLEPRDVDPDDDNPPPGRPTTAAWLSIELVVWAIQDLIRAERQTYTNLIAAPPMLNHPGRMVTLSVNGDPPEDDDPHTITPAEVADHLAHILERYHPKDFLE